MGSVAVSELPLLLDTAALIFWHADSPRLPAHVRKTLATSLERAIYVSAVSAFEIATKVRIGKLRVPPTLLSDFQYVVESDGFRLLELDAKCAVLGGTLVAEHRDPFDRLLAAQALQHGCVLVTPDFVFAEQFGVEVYW
ncbi:MAG: type II toxin-antitoxin system VapC family toxin [Gemmatimonas sp.]